MTRTEERLIDALAEAARAQEAGALRPLIAPERGSRRPWVAPVAATVSLLMVVALGLALSGQVPGSGRINGAASPITPPRYYVATEGGAGAGGEPAVRSTATGAVLATVPVPVPASGPGFGENLVAAAAGGTFFVIASLPKTPALERIYRFRVTASGRVTGFAAIPGAPLGGGAWSADAIAASPNGAQVAVSLGAKQADGNCGTPGQPACPPQAGRPDYLVVVNTATGARSVWRGGVSRPGTTFGIASLSWTADGRELVFLGQWCAGGSEDNETCAVRGEGRDAEVWALNPASGGGALDSGHLLLRQSARYPYIAQALISPDGRTIIAAVLTGRALSYDSYLFPGNLAVTQISATTGRRLGVLYRSGLGPEITNLEPDFLALIPGPGRAYIVRNTVLECPYFTSAKQLFEQFRHRIKVTCHANGWIDQGRLVPLQPNSNVLVYEAW
jgi:hypothetical protein